jgi:hypothetical protein
MDMDIKEAKEISEKENKHKQQRDASSREEKRKLLNRGKKRRFPIWLRLLLFICGVIICFAVGTMIGYGVLGDGEPMNVFEKETWTHIIDLVEKEA